MMNNITPQPKKLLARILIILGITSGISPAIAALVSAISGSDNSQDWWISFWFNLFNPLAILLILSGWYLLHPPKVMKSSRLRTYGWVFWFTMASFFAWAAKAAWFDPQREDFGGGIEFGLPLIMIMFFAILLSKFIRRKPWLETIAGDGDLEPRDERELFILGKSSRFTFGISMVLAIVLMAVLVSVPLPSSRTSIVYLFVSYIFLQNGFRSFIAWRMGLR